jgi:muconolactone delta-isomerase
MSLREGIVKMLAIEVEAQDIQPEQFQPYLRAEARRVWTLYQEGTIRELYFRADRSTAVLILEAADLKEAKQILASLPLVQAGLIDFDVMPLVPYPGFARLFGE